MQEERFGDGQVRVTVERGEKIVLTVEVSREPGSQRWILREDDPIYRWAYMDGMEALVASVRAQITAVERGIHTELAVHPDTGEVFEEDRSEELLSTLEAASDADLSEWLHAAAVARGIAAIQVGTNQDHQRRLIAVFKNALRVRSGAPRREPDERYTVRIAMRIAEVEDVLTPPDENATTFAVPPLWVQHLHGDGPRRSAERIVAAEEKKNVRAIRTAAHRGRKELGWDSAHDIRADHAGSDTV